MEKIVHDYETMFIVNATLEEDAMRAIVDKFKALIEANGTMEAVDEWGTRKLAYPINYETDGYYVLYTYDADVAFPAELDRVFNITDGVLRSLIVAR